MNEKKKQSGLGIAGMVIGIVSLLLLCVAIGGITSIIGLVLSIVAVTKKDKAYGTAIAGIVLNAIALLLFVLVLSINNVDENKPKDKNTSLIENIETSETTTEEEATIEYCNVGQSITNEKWKISFLSAKEYDCIESEYYSSYPKQEGNKYLILFFEVENVGKKDDYFNILNFESYIDSYSADEETFFGGVDGYDSLTGDVAVGKKLKGYIGLEVSPNWEEVETSYVDGIWSSSKIANFKVTPNDIKE